ncbi:ferrichrome-binding protein (plasmid) [Halostagnicola larsenii XH-48]|uniref:Ferrichrome-binding protein n=1 Tax=Halostagnicola larsenii XH-48 TaxID=797299 RepID=W0JWE0_9EURY|nr:ABC transporter substrate-binding protein [Halostagnicola larsenii]AHG01570.1 ferrichrome-binding protein [Halostagnicola larsenii XH-48]
MNDESTIQHETLTRRDALKYGTTAVGGGLFAGCSELVGQDEDERTGSSGTGTYSVTMSPAGEITLEQPPENVLTILPHHADMALAAGHGDAVSSMLYNPEYNDTIWNKFLERLPGVSVDWADLPGTWDPDKELLYELDSDLHLADPAYMTNMQSWTREDIAEIGENVAPWFGNTLSNANKEPPEEWADQYEYYTLWEIFEKVAQVFGAEERYTALTAVRSSLLERIDERRPSTAERPSTAVIQPFQGSFWVYHLNEPGFLYSHTRPLGAIDAFADALGDSGQIGGQVDYETLLEQDPDVLLVTGMMGQSGIEEVRNTLTDDPVGRQLTAVETDRVYAGGVRNQGPILNLFQLEMTAKQLYPDVFGEWPTYTDGPYPEIPVEEQLFDRQEVAAIITGDR